MEQSCGGQAGLAGALARLPAVARPANMARRARAGAAALRRGARMAPFALAVAAALLGPVPLLGQEGDAPTPGQNKELIDALSERVRDLEDAAGRDPAYGIDVPTAILAVVAIVEAVNYVAQALRGRVRPVLAWSACGDGLKFTLSEMPGGAKFLAVRITNVGQAAAVDIVERVGVTFSAKRARVRPGSRPHHVGSLYPGASTQVVIPLSDAEHKRVLDGETMTFRLLLGYGSMGGRRYTYSVSGMCSGDLRILVGIVGKELPARERRGPYGSGRERARARGRGQPLNARAGRGRP